VANLSILSYKRRQSQKLFSGERKLQDFQRQIFDSFDQLDLNDMKAMMEVLNQKLTDAEAVSDHLLTHLFIHSLIAFFFTIPFFPN